MKSSAASLITPAGETIAFPNHTVFELLRVAAERHPNEEAIVFGARRTRYSELVQRAERLAAALAGLEVAPGDHVGILLPNCPEFVEAYFAIAATGAVIVPLSTRLGELELERVLSFSDVSVLFVARESGGRPLLDLVLRDRARFPKLRQVIVVEQNSTSPVGMLGERVLGYASLFERAPARLELPRPDPATDVALMLFTSGTTSEPKGVMLSHRNIVGTAFNENAAMEASERDRFLLAVPFFHVFGAVVGILCATAASATMVVLERFDAEQVLAQIEREKCTILYGTPTMFVLEMNAPNFEHYDLRSLRTGMIAAAPCPVELIHQIMTRMHCNILISYGLTETSPALTITRFEDSPEVRAETVGKALPGVELKVVNDERREMARGEAGELAARGYANMQRYYKNPELTAEVMDEAGWLYTGDMATLDANGYVRLLGRKKDMIKRGGLAIFPPDIESYLYRHPAVKDAAVVGVPDPVLGERSRAYIVRKAGASLTEPELLAFCRGQLSDYKIPDHICFVEALPVTPSGKIHKVALREQAALEAPLHARELRPPLALDGARLDLEAVIGVADGDRKVELPDTPALQRRLTRATEVVRAALSSGAPLYGVNTNFGGLAQETLSDARAALLQENLIWGLKCSLGRPLSAKAVRAAMVIRANMLSKGASGVRFELVSRFVTFLNRGLTPIVRDLGSIGASGDLIPLAQIAGALLGLDASFQIEHEGKPQSALTALAQVGLEPLALEPKEGLALVNGTSVLSALAAIAVSDAERALDLSLWINALLCEALVAARGPFEAFVHELKPHPGQKLGAAKLRQLLSALPVEASRTSADLVQDRYSIRCLPQFFGPIIEQLGTLREQVETEINSIDDNPLVDIANERLVQAGNFYGQYIGMGMDQLRQSLALVAKQLDAQVALLVMPELNKGLPGSLAIDDAGVKFGLKGLQICLNSIVPRLLHLGNPLVSFFPTHAEQLNQNVNSQGFNAAVLATESVSLFRYALAASLVFAVQGVELRAHERGGSYHGSNILSEPVRALYQAFYHVVGRTPSLTRPLVERNYEISLDALVSAVFDDLEQPNSKIFGVLLSHKLGEAFL